MLLVELVTFQQSCSYQGSTVASKSDKEEWLPHASELESEKNTRAELLGYFCIHNWVMASLEISKRSIPANNKDSVEL